MSDRTANFRRPCSTRRRSRQGFTLVELMVSSAIALIVIIGIELVFGISSKTIGVGETLSAIQSQDRSAQAVFNSDLQSADLGSDCPAFMIRSSQVYAFESVSDKAKAVQPLVPAFDPAFNTAGNLIPNTFYNYRSHRIDRMGFFARNFFNRQTGGTDDKNGSSPAQYVSPTTANEAYIWYGHVAQPNNAYLALAANGSPVASPAPYFYDPGDTATTGNDNNAFATDWILGRAAIILDPVATNDLSYLTTTTSDGDSFGPLSIYSKSMDSGSYNSTLYQGRYDQAITSISSFNQTLSTNYTANNTNSAYSTWNGSTYAWYTYLMGTPPTGTPLFSGRIQSTPYPIKITGGTALGLTNNSLAHTFPNFIRGCTQFMVEYTGNYYTKDAYGNPAKDANKNLLPAGPDPAGTLDFQLVPVVTSSGTVYQKQVRWYGFPRHTCSGEAANTNGLPAITPQYDVVPLGAWLKANNVGPMPTFERYCSSATSSTNWVSNIGTLSPTTDFSVGTVVPQGAEYVAAWGPDTTEGLPKMVRITIAMDDPNGNLTNPQLYEYVINLQP